MPFKCPPYATVQGWVLRTLSWLPQMVLINVQWWVKLFSFFLEKILWCDNSVCVDNTCFLYKLKFLEDNFNSSQSLVLNKVVFMLMKNLIMPWVYGNNSVYVVKYEWEELLIPICVHVISTLMTFNRVTLLPF